MWTPTPLSVLKTHPEGSSPLKSARAHQPRGQRNLKVQPPPAGKRAPLASSCSDSLERKHPAWASGGTTASPEEPEPSNNSHRERPALCAPGFWRPRHNLQCQGDMQNQWAGRLWRKHSHKCLIKPQKECYARHLSPHMLLPSMCNHTPKHLPLVGSYLRALSGLDISKISVVCVPVSVASCARVTIWVWAVPGSCSSAVWLSENQSLKGYQWLTKPHFKPSTSGLSHSGHMPSSHYCSWRKKGHIGSGEGYPKSQQETDDGEAIEKP